jgi:hypothetical protein
MIRRVSRYDEHPSHLDTYNQVIGRSSMPTNLPLISESTGQSPWRVILPMITLFFVVTQLCATFAPDMFLGWFTHSVCFLLLGSIVYHLCPPQWTERTEVNDREVIFEYLGLTGYHVDRVPLVQYRGIIPITHTGLNQSGVNYKEYGVALRHADPTKTIILALSPIQHKQTVEHFATLLKVKALHDQKFALQLKSKSSYWKSSKDQSVTSL